MGYLTVISETGFPHSACFFEYNGQKHWRGFKPRIPKIPVCKGYVDTSDRSSWIDRLVKFEFSDHILEQVREQIESRYNNLYYKVGVGPDCVNLSVDVANLCALINPPLPNIFPDNLVVNLHDFNSSRVIDYR